MDFNDWSINDLYSRHTNLNNEIIGLEDEINDYECEMYLIRKELRDRGEEI